MYKRREIREAAVQYLYFADLESGPEASLLEDAFWEMTQEKSLHQLTQARCKALLHLAQGRAGRLAKLDSHAEAVLPRLKADTQSAELHNSLAKVIRMEGKMNATFDLLLSARKGNETPGQIDFLINEVITLNNSLTGQRKNFIQTAQDFPRWRNDLEPVVAAVTHLDRVSERITHMDDPASTLGDFAHLRDSSAEITSFRKDTSQLVRSVLTHREEIDKTLDGLIKNFSPERIAPVDRAIMRLACFEIQHCPDIPKAVSINEAVEIAKRFSTSESGRFINGVLDAI